MSQLSSVQEFPHTPLSGGRGSWPCESFNSFMSLRMLGEISARYFGYSSFIKFYFRVILQNPLSIDMTHLFDIYNARRLPTQILLIEL